MSVIQESVAATPVDDQIAGATDVTGVADDADDADDATVDAGVAGRIARRVRALRADRGLSLEVLAGRSGVSRSMISLIERGEANPTAVVLERIAAGFDVPLAALFDDPRPERDPVSRRAEQATWTDPGSGYTRRNVSPAGIDSPLQIVEVVFPPGAQVTYDSVPRSVRVHEQIWVHEGVLHVTVGHDRHRLGPGDCLAVVVDGPVGFHNAGDDPVRYAVVVTTDPGLGR